jgi:hypothetical protein
VRIDAGSAAEMAGTVEAKEATKKKTGPARERRMETPMAVVHL